MLTLCIQKVAHGYLMQVTRMDRLSSEDFIVTGLWPNTHVLLTETSNVVIDRSSLLCDVSANNNR